MQTSDNNSKINIQSLIQKIQAKSPNGTFSKQSKFFPYIETYGQKHDGQENALISKSIKFRESYIHNKTLRYLEPTFSYKLVLAKLKNDFMISDKPNKRPKARSLDKNSYNIQNIISKADFVISKNTEQVPKTVRHYKTKSQFPNGITKMKIARSPLHVYMGMTPDLLRVTNFNFKNRKKDNMSMKNNKLSKGKKLMENLTFYKDIQMTDEDINDSDNIFIKTKYPFSAKRTVKETQAKITCDAISNTD